MCGDWDLTAYAKGVVCQVEANPGDSRNFALVVPIKRFSDAKRRLAGIVSAPDREQLARAMAERVLGAGRGLRIIVVSNDDAVSAWAVALHAEVVHDGGGGLNGAVRTGVDFARGSGSRSAIIIHADIPLATSLDRFVATPAGTATIVPDARNDGTNVMVVPTDSKIVFQYGPGSFGRHHRELLRVGLNVIVSPDVHLGADVDHPSDLAVARNAGLWPIRPKASAQ